MTHADRPRVTFVMQAASNHSAMIRLRVECYAGYKADERPLRFVLGDRRYEVEEVLDQWYGPDLAYFRVRADDGNVYILQHSLGAAVDIWTLKSFRSSRK